MEAKIIFDKARAQTHKIDIDENNKLVRKIANIRTIFAGIQLLFTLWFLVSAFRYYLLKLSTKSFLSFGETGIIPVAIICVLLMVFTVVLQERADMARAQKKKYTADILYMEALAEGEHVETYIEQVDSIARLHVAISTADGVIRRSTVATLGIKEKKDVSAPVAFLENDTLYIPFMDHSMATAERDSAPANIV